ncbi:hypothetical protein [Rhodanobacter sp. DHB23]|uniref:hypothetical protein n=1 Tax=Rhodanobacter sp. DHB23 TaxID=2775923 RepID=UPI001784AAB4|nr:hypothetical protein [Rhodanobacter sp. DHB23]MBD8873251.1 hypothetical protein [Rhodanobacter sp. DHB23]
MRAGADSPDALHMHAPLLQFSGRIDEAQLHLERILERWPRFGDAMMMLAYLRKQRPEAHRLDWINKQLRQMTYEITETGREFVRVLQDAR